ncbi:bifunctional UDP-N-acetylmuramoyl-L-alanyl-D-glutamate--2,6-diaminopimelate ligase MurE/UDP-N-acetylmuramoyl-tripeptide--D-alanyl-D-alanine ligase MurF [Brackiella oedipodis]|uniref:bifunctional UDP-N-acetylmuramoyl-L-alanyl-D-glutamate--2, 6-diaminopimelate ligase MurE/UDP-N-acetylmuramoyl-tripeptide--D-alanyl-D-alanine ligase MurF n=1 Tax=Brackiella oedipodis TaxID=124225 RepID=UPI00048ADBD7|nr:bifunctional UDP-N-acetylmuramoyl-L-alanyl-D-glutamate--2,6-diaminopimelate ligase MurE/UDP-N-acetylmuramoyl-tripeptide--D-alanyl-D-alanine ligase MurF [Brackiella oedipodis]
MSSTDIITWLQQQGCSHAHLRLDSRDIQASDVFVACKGLQQHGIAYCEQALANGCKAVLIEADSHAQAVFTQAQAKLEAHKVPYLFVENLHAKLAQLADDWYQAPSESVKVIAVTGTNGKTSCANWIASGLNLLGHSCAVMGTLGTFLPDGTRINSSLTTPDILTVQSVLAQLRQQQISYLVLEASSIGIEQGRLQEVRIHTAAFTNLSQDHLDYHGTMANYENAKALLFQWPQLQNAIINLDDAAGQRIYANCQAQHKISYSATALDASVHASDYQVTHEGMAFTITAADHQCRVRTPILGCHNLSNLLLVYAVLQQCCPEQALDAVMSQLVPVEGRMQHIHLPSTRTSQAAMPLVMVDYAHTPDALQRVLEALRPIAQERGGQIHCVFGCGGNRDRSKRPLMGQIVAQAADMAYVTSDNPRFEEPAAIIQDILQGAPTQLQHADVERPYSILLATLKAQAQDIVLIAGKGHETYQEIKGQRRFSDDREWARLGLLLRTAPSIATDTRKLQNNELFIALKGENFDAHRFLAQVQEKQALAAVVQTVNEELDLPQIKVADTLYALQVMARAWRQCFTIPIIAVTGSNGKTTTKEMIASILKQTYGEPHYLATAGNLNNHIGVPLTLLRLRPSHKAAVIELGMNHPNEIAVLAHMVQPSVALVTNAQREHQEFMQSVEAVALENGSVFHYLRDQGTAIYPDDETYSDCWRRIVEQHPGLNTHTFGLLPSAQSYATQIHRLATGMNFEWHCQGQQQAVQLQVQGLHNVRNALAAASACAAAGIDKNHIECGLQQFAAVQGRMQTHVWQAHKILIDDSYNANPDSVRAAIDVLATLPHPQALVLGSMAEVGENGPAMHAEVGAYAKHQGIDFVFCFGQATQETVNAFGQGAYYCDKIDKITALMTKHQIQSALVKGSRSMHMERIVHQLLEV